MSIATIIKNQINALSVIMIIISAISIYYWITSNTKADTYLAERDQYKLLYDKQREIVIKMAQKAEDSNRLLSFANDQVINKEKEIQNLQEKWDNTEKSNSSISDVINEMRQQAINRRF